MQPFPCIYAKMFRQLNPMTVVGSRVGDLSVYKTKSCPDNSENYPRKTNFNQYEQPPSLLRVITESQSNKEHHHINI